MAYPFRGNLCAIASLSTSKKIVFSIHAQSEASSSIRYQHPGSFVSPIPLFSSPSSIRIQHPYRFVPGLPLTAALAQTQHSVETDSSSHSAPQAILSSTPLDTTISGILLVSAPSESEAASPHCFYPPPAHLMRGEHYNFSCLRTDSIPFPVN